MSGAHKMPFGRDQQCKRTQPPGIRVDQQDGSHTSFLSPPVRGTNRQGASRIRDVLPSRSGEASSQLYAWCFFVTLRHSERSCRSTGTNVGPGHAAVASRSRHPGYGARFSVTGFRSPTLWPVAPSRAVSPGLIAELTTMPPIATVTTPMGDSASCLFHIKRRAFTVPGHGQGTCSCSA